MAGETVGCTVGVGTHAGQTVVCLGHCVVACGPVVAGWPARGTHSPGVVEQNVGPVLVPHCVGADGFTVITGWRGPVRMQIGHTVLVSGHCVWRGGQSVALCGQ